MDSYYNSTQGREDDGTLTCDSFMGNCSLENFDSHFESQMFGADEQWT
jgi:hypothetical protein